MRCNICGREFIASSAKHYIARDNEEYGAVTVIKDSECKLYDAFDCPSCGCQIIAQERKRIFIPESNFKMEDEKANE